MEWVLDIESNGLLPTCTFISCMRIKSVDGKYAMTFLDKNQMRDGHKSIEYGVKYIKACLDKGDVFIAHNAQFDFGILYKLHKLQMLDYFRQIKDTMLMSQQMFPKWALKDHPLSKSAKLEFHGLAESHSLKAWGRRVGVYKHESPTDYSVVTDELLEYLKGDVNTTIALYKYLKKQKRYPTKAQHSMEVYNTLIASYYVIGGWYIHPKKRKALHEKYTREIAQLDIKLSGCFTPYYKDVTPNTVDKKGISQLIKVYSDLEPQMDFHTFVHLSSNEILDLLDDAETTLPFELFKKYSDALGGGQWDDFMKQTKKIRDTNDKGKSNVRNASKWLPVSCNSPRAILEKLVSPVEYYKNGKPKTKKMLNFRYNEDDYRFERKVNILHYPMKSDIELQYFKAGSRHSIAEFFRRKYNHRFTVLSDTNNAVLNEDVMKTLPFDEAPLLARRFKVNKDLSMLNGVFKNMIGDYFYSNISVLGADSTGRASSNGGITKGGNVQQMNSDKEFRELFTVPKGKKFITSDLSSAEVVLLGNELEPFDGGKFLTMLSKGNKDDGTDLHSMNGKALNVPRPVAKGFFYAAQYGASTTLLGYNLCKKVPTDISPKLFTKVRDKLLKRCELIGNTQYYPVKKGIKIPLTDDVVKKSIWGDRMKDGMKSAITGYKEMEKKLTDQVRQTNSLKALDGRILPCDSPHKALNYRLQSGNSHVTKAWIYFSYELIRKKYEINTAWRPIATIHDELSIESDEDLSVTSYIDKCLDDGLRLACKFLKLKEPIVCDTDIGYSWDMH